MTFAINYTQLVPLTQEYSHHAEALPTLGASAKTHDRRVNKTSITLCQPHRNYSASENITPW